MTWDTDKIREKCLELMGWSKTSYQQFGNTYTHWNLADGAKLPDGYCDSTQFPPDPTRCFDDALPLFTLNDCFIRLQPTNDGEAWEARCGCKNHYQRDANPALVVCLARLECLGKLKECEK